ncbi:MAG TPA: alkaline phosphatase family protein, partial [Solirubrobacteraceae bacterium]|nr:alkaline phosphatase family protein [Solirubrobacteraceae bacterium]
PPPRGWAGEHSGERPRIAVCPSQRAAMVYALQPEERDGMRASVVSRTLALEGVDLVAWLARDAHDAPVEAVVVSPERGELRFAPGGPLRDARGASWHLEGAPEALDARVDESGGTLATPAYPDALGRLWAALTCSQSGEVLVSAAEGYEFVDWGGAAHVGGGSHGSLHASDSLAPLVLCGVEPPAPAPGQWAIGDVAGLVSAHFGVPVA